MFSLSLTLDTFLEKDRKDPDVISGVKAKSIERDYVSFVRVLL